MGEGLADGRPDGEATGSEWRTAPLWGIGLIDDVNGHTRLLHDGRARNVEEAILWHGGEAAAAQARFLQLDASARATTARVPGFAVRRLVGTLVIVGRGRGVRR